MSGGISQQRRTEIDIVDAGVGIERNGPKVPTDELAAGADGEVPGNGSAAEVEPTESNANGASLPLVSLVGAPSTPLSDPSSFSTFPIHAAPNDPTPAQRTNLTVIVAATEGYGAPGPTSQPIMSLTMAEVINHSSQRILSPSTRTEDWLHEQALELSSNKSRGIPEWGDATPIEACVQPPFVPSEPPLEVVEELDQDRPGSPGRLVDEPLNPLWWEQHVHRFLSRTTHQFQLTRLWVNRQRADFVLGALNSTRAAAEEIKETSLTAICPTK